MRLNLSAVILTVAAASSVYAAPAVSPVHHHNDLMKRGWLSDTLKPLFEKALMSLQCGACVSALVGAKSIAYLKESWVLDAANGLCDTFNVMPADVCHGLVYSQGPALIKAAKQANLIAGDGKQLCFQVLGACPATAITSGTLNFPKPRPLNAVAPTHSGVQIDVLHLSDWHVDNEYVPGSEGDCDRPLCCRKYADSPLVPKRSAATWGDYGCDGTEKLAKHMLAHIPKVANVNFTILTGDLPPHDIWIQDRAMAIEAEEIAYNTMQAGISSKIYPTVGNHESGPPNLFPTKATGGEIQWLYDSLADDWTRWLPAEAMNTVREMGAYTISPTPGFRIISLNTNFCYTLNFHLYGRTKDYDPNGELKWLVTQLQAAEDAGERVWIIGHVGPSQTDCIQNWSALYYQAVQRYSPHVIAEQFFGHTHYDEFALFYGPGTKNMENAISTAWIAPSVTPYTDLNPGFRVYKVDTKSWNVFDSETYVADLSKASEWDRTGGEPDWHLEYSARTSFGAYVPVAADQPLSASWWHNVTSTFEVNDAAFQQYWTYRGKSANRMAACPKDGPCPKEMICNMRAGKSSDSCTHIAFSVKRDDAEASDVTGLHSLYKRAADAKPWNKKLCGLTANL